MCTHARQQDAGAASGLRSPPDRKEGRGKQGGAGERAGGWWWNRGDMTVRELDRMKSRELNNGRLAMCAAGPLHSRRFVVRRQPLHRLRVIGVM
jgi:hypothetical protein